MAAADTGSVANSGCYWLMMRLLAPARIQVGALGRQRFSPGWYIYTGRARRNLGPRLQRHFTRHKPVRWHIDTLTTHRRVQVVGAVILATNGSGSDIASQECLWNARLGLLPAIQVPMPGFGASDCCHQCPAHLWYHKKPLSLLQLTGLAPESALLLPGVRHAG